MTLAELRDNVWVSLPPLRKRIVGRDAVDDFVTLAVQNWEGEYLAACQDNQQRSAYVHSLLGHIKRLHQAASPYEPQEYGFIWAFLLQAIAVSAIQYLVKWWLERHVNRVLMAGWKQEMTA